MSRSASLRTAFALTLATLAGCLVLLPVGRADPGKGKKYAVLTGVTAYEAGTFPTLRYTENDVEELSKLLKEQSGFAEVRLLTNKRGKVNSADAPTKENIDKALKTLMARKKSEDLILVAFSG